MDKEEERERERVTLGYVQGHCCTQLDLPLSFLVLLCFLCLLLAPPSFLGLKFPRPSTLLDMGNSTGKKHNVVVVEVQETMIG